MTVLKIQIIVQPSRFPTWTGETICIKRYKNIQFRIDLRAEESSFSRDLEYSYPSSDRDCENSL